MTGPPPGGRLKKSKPGIHEVFSKLPESEGYPVMNRLAITFLGVVVNCAILAGPVSEKIGVAQA